MSDVGPDGMQCTDDDTYSAPASSVAFLTTGTAARDIYDTNNVANSLLDHLAAAGPGCSNCITQVTGAPRTCTNITAPAAVTNMKFVGALPVSRHRRHVGDAAVNIEIVVSVRTSGSGAWRAM